MGYELFTFSITLTLSENQKTCREDFKKGRGCTVE